MKSEVLSLSSVMSDDLLQGVGQKICESWRFTISELKNFHKLHTLFCMTLSQVLCRVVSKSARGCTLNTQNGFGFDFLE
jgi:hypothetical protein